MAATSVSDGDRERQRRNAYVAFTSAVPACATASFASANAHSTKTGSLRVTSAWSGVFVGTRRSVQTSRVGASKAAIEGYGLERRHCV